MAIEERRLTRAMQDAKDIKNRADADGMLAVSTETAKHTAEKCWKVFVNIPTEANMNVFVEAWGRYIRFRDAHRAHRMFTAIGK